MQITPTIVEGQVHGGVAQGLGQALYEQLVYDGNGTLLTGSLQDYAVPRAHQLPELTVGHTVSRSPVGPLGVKGIGESGAIAAPAAVYNAVASVFDDRGLEMVDLPLTPETVWRGLQSGGP